MLPLCRLTKTVCVLRHFHDMIKLQGMLNISEHVHVEVNRQKKARMCRAVIGGVASRMDTGGGHIITLLFGAIIDSCGIHRIEYTFLKRKPNAISFKMECWNYFLYMPFMITFYAWFRNGMSFKDACGCIFVDMPSCSAYTYRDGLKINFDLCARIALSLQSQHSCAWNVQVAKNERLHRAVCKYIKYFQTQTHLCDATALARQIEKEWRISINACWSQWRGLFNK